MTGDTERPADFDPDVPETFDSPHEMFRDLRARCPVAYSTAMGGFWAVTKYDDIVRVLTDWETFTTTIQNVVPRVATTQRRPPLHLDPPGNQPYRNAVLRLLTPRRLAPWSSRIEAMTVELLEPLIERGEGDICRDFSFLLPIMILAEFFRLPDDDAARIRVVGSEFNMALQRRDDEKVRQYSDELYAIARALIENRKAAPQDPDIDPISSLLAVRVDGEPLPDDMILGALRQFLMVGIVCADDIHRQHGRASRPPPRAPHAAPGRQRADSCGGRGNAASLYAVPGVCADGTLRCGAWGSPDS